MVNQYTLPPKIQLGGPPDATKVQGFKYICLTCNATCDRASLEAHIAGKSHAKKTTAEDPNIVSKLAQYAKLEAPHRDAKKEQAAGEQTFMEKIRELKAGMTKEQLKEHTKERKRQRAEEGIAPTNNKKKKPTVVPYKCGCCDKEMSAPDVQNHMQGGAHYKKVKQFDGGCWLCNVPAPADAKHFEGKKHMGNMKRLVEVGVPEDAIYAMTQAAAMEVVSIQMGGNNVPPAGTANVGVSKKAKKKAAANGGGAMTIAQMAALAGLGQGKSSKAKRNKKNKKREIAL